MDQMFTVTLTEKEWDAVQLAMEWRMGKQDELRPIQKKIDEVIAATHRNKGIPYSDSRRM